MTRSSGIVLLLGVPLVLGTAPAIQSHALPASASIDTSTGPVNPNPPPETAVVAKDEA
jgi:hypothetical protein